MPIVPGIEWRRRSFLRRVVTTAVLSLCLYGATWASSPLVALDRPWSYLTARVLSVPYWTYSLVPGVLTSALRWFGLTFVTAQEVPPPATAAYLPPRELLREVYGGFWIVLAGSFVYATALSVVRRYRLTRIVSLGLLGGWITTAILIVHSSGVDVGVLRIALVAPEAMLRVADVPPPFDAPLSSGYPYPVIVRLVGIYTLSASLLWIALVAFIGAASRLILRRLECVR